MSTRDWMRRARRVLKLLLVPALCSLVFTVYSSLQKDTVSLDTVLDGVLNDYLGRLPASRSAQKILTIQRSLAAVEPPQSLRDFRFPPAYESHVAKACALLRTKRILLVGPETTFYLHSLWLHALETHDHKPHECPGVDFCNFHHICLPPDYPIDTDRYKFPPKDKELVASGSVLMRYVLSTSLHTAEEKNDTAYTQPVIDTETGIRLKNAPWMYHARKADVILMNRGPIPAPAWTYDGHKKYGNWTFAERLPRHLGPDRSLAAVVVNAAFHATTTRFIPELLESLRTIQTYPAIKHKTLLWHASWFSGFAEVASFPAKKVDDPWALYYNAQVYMQNRLLSGMLPHLGVHFLPRIAPSGTMADTDNPSPDHGPKDSLRFGLGTNNARAMEATFLKSLIGLLERIARN